MSLYPDRETAEKIFEEIIIKRNKTPHPFKPEWEREFRKHCHYVADIASKIASKTLYLNPEKAYVLGLLHDCGRCVDEFAEHRFHANIGYDWMKELGYDDVAKICITHSFYEKDFDLKNFTQPKDDLLWCKEYLKTITYDDYDKLLQLSDVLNDRGDMCTIEYRFKSLSERYHVPYENLLIHVKQLQNIKTYFDNICSCDIYNLIGENNDKRKVAG